ncbi:MAG: uracil-DNA glycosylase, partial [Bacteroidia bacterium]|nr:uracil-DNA glycosylase [Bacteroidia bacterium]
MSEEISNCTRCIRLVVYRQAVAEKPPCRYRGCSYWAKGVPGFGDLRARIWIVGLAPAAHGANRTGRMFTGDSSGDWLYRALYEVGLANQPYSIHREDNLELKDVYISAAIRCAPPQNRPNATELANCFDFLVREYELLRAHIKLVIPLGHIAYRQVQRLFPAEKAPLFRHGNIWIVGGVKVLCSYHPSRQNTQTRRLSWEAWLNIFKTAKS